MIACQADLVQVFTDRCRVMGILFRDGGQADDGVHRGAYVVRHGGKEVRFCPVCGFGGFSGRFQHPVQVHQEDDVKDQQEQQPGKDNAGQQPVRAPLGDLGHGQQGNQRPAC